jgi:RNA polymerase sigma-70 factor, ECF subfamily
MMERRATMKEQASEWQLIAACQQGDREAFRQLFEAHQHRVWSIARHFIGDEAAARDITQQVFLKLFTTIKQFRHDANFATWLYRLVANACMDEQRRRRRFMSFDFFKTGSDAADGAEAIKALDQQPPLQWPQEDDCARLEISAAVQAAVQELPPKLRLAILLKYFEGLSYTEMARVLDCSPGTIASRLNRGHKALAQSLAHLRGEVR